MRRILIILFLFPAIVFGQRFVGEAVGGLSTSQVHGDESEGFNKLGLYGGFYVRTNLSETFSFQTGLRYIGKGSKEEVEAQGVVVHSYKIALHYIEIPLLLRYTYKSRVFFEAGYSSGYLLRSKMLEDDHKIDDNAYNYTNWDFCLLAGFGYHFTERLSGNMGFELSTVSITDHKNMANQFNKVLTIGVQYRFGSSAE